MLHKLVSSMAAAALVAAPVVAQAAPQRAPSALEEAEAAAGSSWVLPAILGIGVLIAIWLVIDSEDDGRYNPRSP